MPLAVGHGSVVVFMHRRHRTSCQAATSVATNGAAAEAATRHSRQAGAMGARPKRTRAWSLGSRSARALPKRCRSCSSHLNTYEISRTVVGMQPMKLWAVNAAYHQVPCHETQCRHVQELVPQDTQS
jgi:hypothetical protein